MLTRLAAIVRSVGSRSTHGRAYQFLVGIDTVSHELFSLRCHVLGVPTSNFSSERLLKLEPCLALRFQIWRCVPESGQRLDASETFRSRRRAYACSIAQRANFASTSHTTLPLRSRRGANQAFDRGDQMHDLAFDNNEELADV